MKLETLKFSAFWEALTTAKLYVKQHEVSISRLISHQISSFYMDVENNLVMLKINGEPPDNQPLGLKELTTDPHSEENMKSIQIDKNQLKLATQLAKTSTPQPTQFIF